ncbi:MAG: hypothetical protein J1F11_02910 [Oscillospiraceae bacterium]|nr:hypothetical protein [Oscillospiraceae bacterium]
MRKKGWIMRSLLSAVTCAAVAVTMSGCKNDSYDEMIQEEPENYIAMAADNAAQSVAEESFSEEAKVIKEAVEEGSFTIEFEVEGIKFSADCYVNEKDQIASLLYTFTGSKGTAASIYGYSDNKLLKFGTQGKSGSHIYDVDLNTLAEKLASSIFAPGSDTYYEMSDSEYEVLLQYVGEINSAITGKTDPGSNYDDIVKAFLDEHPPVTEEKTETSVGGETVEANIFRYNFHKDELRSLIEKLVDEALKQQATTIATTEGYTTEDIKEDMLSELDDLEDYSAELVYYINSNTNVLMQADMKLSYAEKQPEEKSDDEDDYYSYNYDYNAAYDMTISAVLGADPANAAKQSFVLEMNTDYYNNDYFDDSTIVLAADVTKSENKTEVVITGKEDNDEAVVITAVCEKNGDNYVLTFDVPEEDLNLKLEGTLVTDDKSFKLTIDRIAAVNGSTEVAYLPKVVITAKKGGEALLLDAEKEFLDITEDELDQLIEDVEADLEAVFMEFADDSALGSSMKNYVEKAEKATANANARSINIAIASQITELGINDTELKGDIVEGKGYTIVIDGQEYDMSDYLSEDFSGYSYAEINPQTYAVKFALWSEDPIPDEYKREFSYDEQQSLADENIFIGCYPLK